MNIAVIPARGGSKRIPRKNILPFGGQPMIAYAISAARDSGLFEHVVVSTDDDEIAEVAARHGASVPFRRPPELADDLTVTVPVIAHAAQWFVDHGQAPAAVCCITPACRCCAQKTSVPPMSSSGNATRPMSTRWWLFTARPGAA